MPKSNIALLSLLLCGFSFAAQPYPVTWNTNLKLKSRSEIGQRLNQKLDAPVLALVNDHNQKISVSNCANYERATKKGFYALTSYTMAIESQYVKACSSLLTLKKARAAKHSFLQDFSLKHDYTALPAAVVFPSMRGPGPGGTVGSRYRDTRLTPDGKDSVRLESASASQYSRITVEAKGDFNHDGIQDIMLTVGTKMIGGTAGGSNVYIITRLGKYKPITVIH